VPEKGVLKITVSITRSTLTIIKSGHEKNFHFGNQAVFSLSGGRPYGFASHRFRWFAIIGKKLKGFDN
jgi:hypothetical protein